jgi:hypothetical protein
VERIERIFLSYKNQKEDYIEYLKQLWEKYYVAIVLCMKKEAGNPIELPQKK